MSFDHFVEGLEVRPEDDRGSTDIAACQINEAEIEARLGVQGGVGQAFGESQRAFAGLPRGVQLDDGPEVLTQVTRDPTLPPPVPERGGQNAGLAQAVMNLRELRESPEGIAEVQPDIDGLLQCRRCLREMAERAQGLLKERHGLSARRRAEGSLAGSTQVRHRFLPGLAPKRMMGEAI